MPDRSKLGLHINFPTKPERMKQFIKKTRPAIVKVLNLGDVEFAAFVAAESPESLLVGRRYEEDQSLSNPIEAANRHASKILGSSAVRLGIVKIIEGYNEIGPHPTQDYMKFELELCRILHNEGIKYVAGSWSVGCPTIPDWESSWILEVLRVADYIGDHEYCAPMMNDLRGMDPDKPGTGWFTLRYRKWYPNLPEDCKKPLLITECGIDSGAAHWNPGAQGGWRSFTDASGYLGQLKWYDGELRQDDYVEAAAIYCWGTLDPTWGSFCINGEMADRLEEYLFAQNQADLPATVEDYIGEAVQLDPSFIPAFVEAAFQRYAAFHGFGSPRTKEIGYHGELTWKGRPILAQVFMRDDDLAIQRIVWCHLDDLRPWDVKIKHFTRRN